MTKTTGQIVTELWNNNEKPIEVQQLTNAMLTDYDKNVMECVKKGCKQHSHNFFVVVLTKKEIIYKNVIRNYFMSRKTCPPPNYDQIVYSYDRKKEKIDLLWALSSREVCFWYKYNALRVDPEERELLKYVLDFDNGSLDDKCNRLNNKNLKGNNGRRKSY